MTHQRTVRPDDSLLRLLGIANELQQDGHDATDTPNRRGPSRHAAASVAGMRRPTDISGNKHAYLARALAAEARPR